jgi:D-alanyl-D-alanine carboxypeptidase
MQQSLFFTIKAEREQSAAERAKVSAPPGFSEHHTGYALDIGDLAAPETELEPGENDSYKGALELS